MAVGSSSASEAATPPSWSVGSGLTSLWRSRWLVLVASFWLQACAGIGYAFGSFSPLLKSTLGYSQQQINILGNAKDIGDAVGLISGSLCEILPTWAVILIGAAENLIGYGWIWLIVTNRAPTLPFWVICALIFVGTNGETYFNTAALVTNVKNFPKSRGQAVGLLKGAAGLCGAIFTQVYTTFFYPDQSAYIFLLATGPVIVALCVMSIIRPLKSKASLSSRSEMTGFQFFYSDCLVLAAYLMGVMILQDFVSVSQSVSLIITLVLFFFLLLPLSTPLVCWIVKPKAPAETERSKRGSLEAPLLDGSSTGMGIGSDAEGSVGGSDGSMSRKGSFTGSVDYSELEDEKSSEIDLLSEILKKKKMEEMHNQYLHAVAEGAVRVKRKKGPRRGENFTLVQALVKADFWLLFWALVCGSGTGLTAIDNMGQISESQGYSTSDVFVSMMSIWNFLGRLAGGYASEIITRVYVLPRPLAVAVAQLMMAMGHFLFAMAWPGSLYVATFLVGMGYGSHWGIVPAIVSELFGLKNFGVLYNFYIMASPAGSIVFSGFLAGYLYDIEAAKQQAVLSSTALKDGTLSCYGASCFRMTFLIMTGVCVLGVCLTMLLCIRTARVYRMLYGQGGSSMSLH